MPAAGVVASSAAQPDHAMVAVIGVVLAEEHGGRIGTHDRLGPQASDQLHQSAPELVVIVQLAIEIAEKVMAGHAEDAAGGGHLLAALSRQGDRVDRWVERAFVALGADADPDVRAGRRPTGKGPAA